MSHHTESIGRDRSFTATIACGVFTATAQDEETAKRLVEIWENTPKDIHRNGWSAAALREAGYTQLADEKDKRAALAARRK